MEHHSNLVPWQQLAKRKKMKLKIIKLKEDFTLDFDDAKRKITGKTGKYDVLYPFFPPSGYADEKVTAGIGKQLLKHLILNLKSSGFSEVKVLADSVIPANYFYQKNGFRLIKTTGVIGRKINVYKLEF